MDDILNLSDFPLDRPDSKGFADLVSRCTADLADHGMSNLEGLLRPKAASQTAEALLPKFETDAFVHSRRHNIYFKKSVDGLPGDHPALKEHETRNRTLCADQLSGSAVLRLYEWPPLHRFLARIMGKDALYPMQDPLARVNVMAYASGDTLNWHFDRSEFTTTLLLQAPEGGGVFEYRTDLRRVDDPNYDGVAALLCGADPDVRRMSVTAGTLNVFRGINTPHRVTPVRGDRPRLIAVFSYFDRPGVVFSPEEQIGFYGRSV